MAKRGSTKALSVLQEERIARAYHGMRSPSSGGAATDRGDVRIIGPLEQGSRSTQLIECKHRGTYDKPAKSISVVLGDFEKIADEAWSEGRDPALALSVYAPDSVLADSGGFVDLVVRLVRDDVEYVSHG